MNVHLQSGFLKSEINRLMEACPELAEDEELRADMMEAETDLHKVMSKLVRRRQERLALASGITDYMADLADRKARMVKAAEGEKAIMQAIMEAADLSKVTLPEATVSITKPRTSVKIVDVNALPQGFYVVERTAKKAEIKAELEAGHEVPGAELVLGDEGLMVRTK